MAARSSASAAEATIFDCAIGLLSLSDQSASGAAAAAGARRRSLVATGGRPLPRLPVAFPSAPLRPVRYRASASRSRFRWNHSRRNAIGSVVGVPGP